MRVCASARIGKRVHRDEQDARTEGKIGMGRNESPCVRQDREARTDGWAGCAHRGEDWDRQE